MHQLQTTKLNAGLRVLKYRARDREWGSQPAGRCAPQEDRM